MDYQKTNDSTKTTNRMQGNDTQGKRTTKKDKIIKIGTWNVRGINGKEMELIEEFENAQLVLLAISEAKKKGNGITQTKTDHVLIHSGVKMEERPRAGVACLIHKNSKQYICNWKAVSERILVIELKLRGNDVTVIVIYGPSEDEIKVVKDEFWEILNTETEKAKGTVILMGEQWKEIIRFLHAE